MIAWMLLTTLAVAGQDTGFDHSHAAFSEVIAGAVEGNGVDYKALAQRTDALDAYLATLAQTDISGFSKDQQLAFWVNAYNALTLDLMLDEGPPKSILDLDGGKVWSTRSFPIAGAQRTLDEIEHKRARPIADGRVHAVINCASKGCPPLPADAFEASKAEAELDAAARTWVATNAYTLEGSTLKVSQIFNWFGEDFAKPGAPLDDDAKQVNALAFIRRYASDEAKAKLTAVKTVTWQEYDWSLNQK